AGKCVTPRLAPRLPAGTASGRNGSRWLEHSGRAACAALRFWPTGNECFQSCLIAIPLRLSTAVSLFLRFSKVEVAPSLLQIGQSRNSEVNREQSLNKPPSPSLRVLESKGPDVEFSGGPDPSVSLEFAGDFFAEACALAPIHHTPHVCPVRVQHGPQRLRIV